MEINDKNWNVIKKLFSDASHSGGYFSIATTKKDGTPHVSPFGSVILTEKNKGYFFDELSGKMSENLKHNKRVCIMAVNMSKWFLLKSLVTGRLSSPLAVRLIGTVSEKRDANPGEIKIFQNQVKYYKIFKAYDILWKNFAHVRDITFESFENINAHEMTYKYE